ncbi:hypothetical protein [Olsenella massiliensis]|uniref:hypothetical protein n=1 Tax=Olsenella massiliensis TaxID=1622075 RepID=UPI0011DE1E17|nr:hypothetical protein [Olsenella massiliensis]
MAGFKDVVGTDAIGTQSMGAYLSAIAKMEKEYEALKATPTVLAGADGEGFYAAAGSIGDGAVMLLNRSYMGNAAKHARSQRDEESSGFKMPTNGRITSQAAYTVKHEYGHLLQNALYQEDRI